METYFDIPGTSNQWRSQPKNFWGGKLHRLVQWRTQDSTIRGGTTGSVGAKPLATEG